MTAPEIKMYRSDTLVEIGTSGNPIDFGFCDAGESTLLPYDIVLYNDKDGSEGSDDAKNIVVELLSMYVTQQWTSNGNPSQSFTMSYFPTSTTIEEEVTVNDIQWRKVTSFSGMGATDEVYTYDETTGVLTFGNGVSGKIPPNTETIKITYTPDLNVFGKTIYEDGWIYIRSDGVVENEIHISIEEGIKENNTYVSVLHFPWITEVVGVWDNIGKTGTNYYTGGSYDADTGRITLGTPLTTDTPYIEYKYKIKDDAEVAFTQLTGGVEKSCENPIPKTNAKRLQLKVEVPGDADTESGAYLKVFLRVKYTY